ncbi:MAG: AraC family transcriptional regulator ligand-binding domain-containing protein [Zoogloeaceae bacterium]|nr:AraC family transcriptional regulator ligand-binding domain-containing protein [Zoogloeaceae bacterium]
MFSLSHDLLLLLVRGAKARIGHDLVAELGLDQRTDSGWVDGKQLFSIWKALEQRSGDINLGLHLGEVKGAFPASNVLFAAMLASPSVGCALQRLCRYHAVVADLVQPTLITSGKSAVLTWQSQPALHRQQAECIASLAVSILRQLAERPLDLRVTFTHPRPTSIREHERIFGRNLTFGAPELAVFFPAELLTVPVAPHSRELLVVLDGYAEQLLSRARSEETTTSKVIRLLGLAIGDGQPVLARIASQMGMSGRVLQSKLRSDGTSFQKLLNKVRMEKASHLLTEGALQVSEVAFLVGYSDQCAFNHAFKRWTGHTPYSFRQSKQGAENHSAAQI